MRRLAALAFAAWAGTTWAAPSACSGRPDVPLEAVAPGVWRVPASRGEADASNGGLTAQLVVIRDAGRVWLVGSGPSPAFGRALACAVRRTVGRPVTDLVVTRAAPELAMGSVAFSAEPGAAAARQWALPDVIAVMRARCPACLDRLKARVGAAGVSLRAERIRVPWLTVGAPGAPAGRLGPFDWLALTRAPDERTLVLRLRRARLVVAQGLLWAGDVPLLRDTDSAALLVALHALRTFADGARLLGEQGDLADTGAIDAHIDYLATLRATALPHLIRGDVDGAAGLGVDLPGFEDRPGYARWHPLNVQHVWRELEPEIFR